MCTFLFHVNIYLPVIHCSYAFVLCLCICFLFIVCVVLVPGTPVNLTGVPLNETSLQLNWSWPINTLCTVITYKLTYWLVRQGACQEVNEDQITRKQRTTGNHSLVIGDLLPDTLYRVKIVAITRAGVLSEEAEISNKTFESGQS